MLGVSAEIACPVMAYMPSPAMAAHIRIYRAWMSFTVSLSMRLGSMTVGRIAFLLIMMFFSIYDYVYVANIGKIRGFRRIIAMLQRFYREKRFCSLQHCNSVAITSVCPFA